MPRATSSGGGSEGLGGVVEQRVQGVTGWQGPGHPGRGGWKGPPPFNQNPPPPIGGIQIGTLPSAEVLSNLGLSTISPETRPSAGLATDPFAAIMPFLSSFAGAEQKKAEGKPQQLIAKGLPTLPAKLVEKAQSLEFVEMEEFLPTPRSLRLAEQRKLNPSLQDALVGALTQFQASQQRRSQRRVLDILTWTRCFSLYIAVVAKAKAEMVPVMVAHLHTVYKLQRRAPEATAWLEYDVQFRMEAAASEDRVWNCTDPWQYLSCLPGPSAAEDPFEMAVERSRPQLLGVGHAHAVRRPGPDGQDSRPAEVAYPGKGKGPATGQPVPKKTKKSDACRWFNSAPGGCPYGTKCTFVHRCGNCWAVDDHTTGSCPFPRRP